jgi:glycosyltransferase involved in cell wall biosynthesis
MERILFVDLGSNYGGVETYLEGLIDILRPKHQCYAVCSLRSLTANLRARGVRVVRLPFMKWKWCKGLRLLLALWAVPCLVFGYRIRTVALSGYFESLLLLPLRVLGCKTIYTMHGPFETDMYSWWRSPARFLPRFLSMRCLRFATIVVCVSETVGKIARTVLPDEKILVISNWVQIPARCTDRYTVRDTVELLFVGRLEQYKGIQLILEAMKGYPNILLRVIGDGSYRAELESLAQGLNVQFLGFQPNPAVFYESTDIFVNPSLGPEGLPLVSLEAMGHGLPCIFSDIPVHLEITEQGAAAAIFHRGSALDLRDQLRYLGNSEALRRAFGAAARDVVKRKYSREIAAGMYARLFERCLGVGSQDLKGFRKES